MDSLTSLDELWKMTNRIESKQESSRKENIIESHMENSNKFLNDNLKNNTKGDTNLYKNIPTPEYILNEDIATIVQKEKKIQTPVLTTFHMKLKKKTLMQNPEV